MSRKRLTDCLIRIEDHFGNAAMLDPKHIVSLAPYRDTPDITVVGTRQGAHIVVSGSADQVAQMIDKLADELEAA